MSTQLDDAKANTKRQPRDWLKLVVDNSRVDEGERFRQQIAGMDDVELDRWLDRMLRRLFQ